MKIIDLLVKKSKGEETPNTIKWQDIIFRTENYFGGCNYIDEDGDYLFSNVYAWQENLNDEVEIIEDIPTKLEKIISKTNATLNCIKDSEKIQDGEYFVIHSDFIIALEEEVKQIKDYISNLEQEKCKN